MIAIIGVIVLPITTGDTALRSLRIMAGDALHIDSSKKKNNLLLALPIFAVVAGVLIFAKANSDSFGILWRYFSWANETIAVFSFTLISVYMSKNKMPYLMALLPGMFYMYVVCAYILSAKIGFGLSWTVSYITAAALTAAYTAALVTVCQKHEKTA